MLFLGAASPDLAGACGAVAGLNGRTVVADADAAAAHRVEKAAAEAGALVEFVTLQSAQIPLDAGSFGLVVIPDFGSWPAGDRLGRLAEAFRMAAPGARIVVLVSRRRGLFSSSAGLPTSDDVLHLFTRVGGVAGRKLAEVDGVTYYEVRKPR